MKFEEAKQHFLNGKILARTSDRQKIKEGTIGCFSWAVVYHRKQFWVMPYQLSEWECIYRACFSVVSIMEAEDWELVDDVSYR